MHRDEVIHLQPSGRYAGKWLYKNQAGGFQNLGFLSISEARGDYYYFFSTCLYFLMFL